MTWLGLQVETFHPESRPEGTYGYVDPDENEHLIWLCRSLPETTAPFYARTRTGSCTFTLRSYLKHTCTLLGNIATQDATTYLPRTKTHAMKLTYKKARQAQRTQEQFQERLGVGQSYDPRNQRELAANIFAAELLMPLERVKTLYLRERIAPTGLAATFFVSPLALLNRLAELLKHPQKPSVQEETAKVTVPKRDTTYDTFQQAAIEAPTPALIVAGTWKWQDEHTYRTR